MNRQITALFLTGILLLSSCSSPMEESSSDTLSSMASLLSIINTSSEIDFEVGPIDIDTKEYMLPASIDRTDSLTAVYDGENIVTSPIFLDWYIEADNTKYDIDNRITVLSFVDGFTWGQFEYGMMYVKNTNNEDFSYPAYIFNQNQLFFLDISEKENIPVYEANGDLAVLLNFNYGTDGTTFDPNFFKNHYTGVSTENVLIGITYSAYLKEYVVFYTKNPYFPGFEEERDPDDEYAMKVHVATFNKKGDQTMDFPLENFYYQALVKGTHIPIPYIFIRENNIVLLNTGYDHFITVNLIQKTATIDLTEEELSSLFEESPQVLKEPHHNSYKLAQESCPLLLNRLNTGEITIASKENPEVVLETIAAGYDPAFYSFNSDGSCNVVFTVPESSDE